MFYRFDEQKMTIGVNCDKRGHDTRRYVTDSILKCSPTSSPIVANLLDDPSETEAVNKASTGSSSNAGTVVTFVIVMSLLATAVYYLIRYWLHDPSRMDYVQLTQQLEKDLGEKTAMLN